MTNLFKASKSLAELTEFLSVDPDEYELTKEDFKVSGLSSIATIHLGGESIDWYKSYPDNWIEIMMSVKNTGENSEILATYSFKDDGLIACVTSYSNDRYNECPDIDLSIHKVEPVNFDRKLSELSISMENKLTDDFAKRMSEEIGLMKGIDVSRLLDKVVKFIEIEGNISVQADLFKGPSP